MTQISSSVLQWGGGSFIRALLGPTNTGKTHAAIERMIYFGSGMIGLPLRLLAREVYERVVTKEGAEKVALITGEERIEPPEARYWVCTVESMPVHRPVPFVAIDEIQLATHHRRGHIFTDRLLNCRGTRETWFLGSDTMIPIIERLVPTAEIEKRSRLSQLQYVNPKRISALPKRSAVIAFSLDQVYNLAERIRSYKGGAAVVLGALSPKARNAQVAMFESGEVDYLVSTDAIGMGLNLDIRYVFFGELRKFDGVEYRFLYPSEVGQIAGRAGRFKRDGYFGLTADCALNEQISPAGIEAVCSQVFPATYRINYRNSELDFSSIEGLQQSLSKPPFHGCLQPAVEIEDESSLRALLRMEDIHDSVCRSSANLKILWDVCRIPDYRQNSHSVHVRLLAQIYRQLLHGYLSTSWVNNRINRLEKMDGSINTLMQRIAYTRTWAYIAHRQDWVATPEQWRQRVTSIEEKLSDALHLQLTQHFVAERKSSVSMYQEPKGIVWSGNELLTESVPLGKFDDFSFVPNVEAERVFGAKMTRKYGRKNSFVRANALASEALENDVVFHLRLDLRVCYKGHAIGFLAKGDKISSPRLKILPMNAVDEDKRKKLFGRAEKWVRQDMARLQQSFQRSNISGKIRGVLYLLSEHLGVVPLRELPRLNKFERNSLQKMGVRFGRKYCWSRQLLKPKYLTSRVVYCAVWLSVNRIEKMPTHLPSASLDWSIALAKMVGYPKVGPRYIRVDMLERLSQFLRNRKDQSKFPSEALSWLGCDKNTLTSVLKAMGYRIQKVSKNANNTEGKT